MAMALKKEQPKIITAVPAYTDGKYVAGLDKKTAKYKVRGYAGRLVLECARYVFRPQ